MKILIRLPNWLGDVVMSTAFVNAVHEYYPDAVIDVIVKKELAGIALLIRGLNVVHQFSKKENKGLTGAYKFGKKLRAQQYDLFFNLPESFSSLVLSWASAAKIRVGFNKEGGWPLLTNAYKKPKNIHRVDEYVSLLELYVGGYIRDKKVFLDVDKPKKKITDWVIINFNSEALSRRMPIEKAKKIIDLLTRRFEKAEFTFIGSQKETEFIDAIIADAENKDRIKNFAGKTDLISLSHLLAACSVLLTTDSGPGHLANAVDTPVIVLFGAGNELNTAPYNKQQLTVLRYGKLDCEPCLRNTCELYGVPKCLQLLDELAIMTSVERYLNLT